MADCCCRGKGNPLISSSVVSMGTALLAFAGPRGRQDVQKGKLRGDREEQKETEDFEGVQGNPQQDV